MEAYLIYKNFAMVACSIVLIYQLICYISAEKAVKAHFNQYRWRRWEREHQRLELDLKINAFEMLITILLSMIVVIM